MRRLAALLAVASTRALAPGGLGPTFAAERCAPAAARELCEVEPCDGDLWVRATERGDAPVGLAAAMAAATTPEPVVVVGAPAAVARLRVDGARPVVDVLRSSIAKEQVDRCAASQDACVEALLEAWVESLGDEHVGRADICL